MQCFLTRLEWQSEVLTHASGISLFLELCVHNIAKVFEGILLMDMMWDMEIHNNAPTYINLIVCHPKLDKSGGTTNSMDHMLGKVPPWILRVCLVARPISYFLTSA
jgi:hypothetical protein